MFGFKKEKIHLVALTDSELHRLLSMMTPQEKKAFKRRQKDAENEAYENGFLDGFIIGGD